MSDYHVILNLIQLLHYTLSNGIMTIMLFLIIIFLFRMKSDGVSAYQYPRSATLPSGGQSEKILAAETERNYATHMTSIS